MAFAGFVFAVVVLAPGAKWLTDRWDRRWARWRDERRLRKHPPACLRCRDRRTVWTVDISGGAPKPMMCPDCVDLENPPYPWGG